MSETPSLPRKPRTPQAPSASNFIRAAIEADLAGVPAEWRIVAASPPTTTRPN